MEDHIRFVAKNNVPNVVTQVVTREDIELSARRTPRTPRTNIDKEAENKCRLCHGRQVEQLPSRQEPMVRPVLPEGS